MDEEALKQEEMEFAELHSPLFVKTGEKTGKNLGLKLSENHHKGVKLVYDRDSDELHVIYGGRTTYVPKHNIASMWPLETKVEKPAPQAQPKVQQQITAQVSTPQSHVHAGPGHGKTK